MEQIDVHDLSEEQAQLLQEFVDFLKQRRQAEKSPQTRAETPDFAAWPLGVKGTLSREEIYDHRIMPRILRPLGVLHLPDGRGTLMTH